MNTILNYPGFQALPKGAKQMLLASEEYFFEEPISSAVTQNRVLPPTPFHRTFQVLLRRFTECAARSALSVRRFRTGGLWEQPGTGLAGQAILR